MMLIQQPPRGARFARVQNKMTQVNQSKVFAYKNLRSRGLAQAKVAKRVEPDAKLVDDEASGSLFSMPGLTRTDGIKATG